MRTRLLGILIALMLCVLAALGLPLAAAVAAAEQSKVVVDRLDDAARFAQDLPTSGPSAVDSALKGDPEPAPGDVSRRHAIDAEVRRYHDLYGVRLGIFQRDGVPIAAAPADWRVPPAAGARRPSRRRWTGGAATTRPRSGRGPTTAP